MADLTDPLLQECTNCGTQIDVSDEEPFAQMHCPGCGGSMRVRRQFGSFELVEILGAGGMGAVYRGHDTNLHRPVALKVLRREYSSNPEFIRQFAHEAAITASINHPNVVKVYSSGADHGLFYIAMELVDKGSLDDLMMLEKKVGELQVLDVGIQVAQGLLAAYERGLIHRDVKPGNILFADAQTAKIVDFGLAVPLDQAKTLGGEVWGTPYYVAPEKLENKPEDFRSDIYSLAASLFHAAAGRPPHDTDDPSIAALRRVKARTVPIHTYAPEISSATAYVINRALQHNPDRRYASYKDFIEHLQYAKEELRQKAAKHRARRKAIQHRPSAGHGGRHWGVIGMVAAVAIGGALLFAFRNEIFTTGSANKNGGQVVDGVITAEGKADYDAARKLLIDRNYPAAATQFASIVDNVLSPQPRRTWAAMHAAVAFTLAGDIPKAKSQWQQIVDQGLFSPDPENQKLAQWFVNTAALAVSDAPIPPELAGQYSRSTYEPFALFALGLKAWSGSQFDRAEELLRSFVDWKAAANNEWVADYQPIAQLYLDDLAVYRTLMQRTSAADEVVRQQAVLPELKKGLEQLKIDGPHRKQLKNAIEQAEQRIAAYTDEQTRIRLEQEASDAKALADVQAKVAPLTAQYRFSEARALIAAVPAVSEKGKRDKDVQSRRLGSLAEFKAQLIRDVMALGYSQPLLRKVGGQIPGKLSRANDQQFESTTPYGPVQTPWPEVAVNSLVQMAKSFIRAEMTAEQKADRSWLIGNFLYFSGRPQDAKVFLQDAATVRPEFKTRLLEYPGVTP